MSSCLHPLSLGPPEVRVDKAPDVDVHPLWPPVLHFPRSKVKGKAVHTPSQVPAMPASCSSSAIADCDAAVSSEISGAAVPVVEHPLLQGEPPNPFTSFDEVQGTRVLVGSADWPRYRYIDRALETSDLPGAPDGRVMLSELASFPSPQIAITQDRGPDLRRAVVVDAGLIGGQVETLDVFPGVTPVGIIRGLRSVAYPRVAEEQLASGHLLCLINRALVDHRAVVPADADVMQFVAVRLPVPDQLAAQAPAQGHVEPKADAPVVRYSGPRPQAPEIPAPVDRPPTPPVPPHVGASRGLVDALFPASLTTRPFTAFDAHYGHRTFYCHGFASHPERLQQVLQASPALGRSPRFQWLDVEVAGLPTPQLVLQAAHVPPQHWTFPLELRVCDGHVCVFIASRHCSVLEFMARASDSCRLQGHMSALVAEGVFALEVDGHHVDAEASTVFKFASIATGWGP